ncbi:conserved hypothetical protein [Caldicellulosiruptor hydrothermalis 108]|uniref:Uncharacterized protein n=1 Tax=Caldicellulosiruptor hydrothermalis (strain DSM 18901 / VKM B-2411 / 108) TaxID=632292 RepID=E4QBL0_CALH1|nr:hypothetical protein [Caldicellulosiruptor hydrothermalis]ADQ06112.1 conserved hypothetical protein [Caldicellulosiruptor hydrothermalis 108]
MLYHPDEITIDGLECYLDWSKHSTKREVERLFTVEDVIATLQLACGLLDFKSGTKCWVRNHTRGKSVLVRVVAGGQWICLEIITLLNKIAKPKKGTEVIDVWEEK